MRIPGTHLDPRRKKKKGNPKKKKFNAKKTKKELDILWSRFIRRRDPICQKCGKTQSSQGAHIFGRGNLSTRWDVSNGVGLCFFCHLYWAHREPVEFTLWIIGKMGEEAFGSLKKKSQEIFDSSELKNRAEEIKKELLKLSP